VKFSRRTIRYRVPMSMMNCLERPLLDPRHPVRLKRPVALYGRNNEKHSWHRRYSVYSDGMYFSDEIWETLRVGWL